MVDVVLYGPATFAPPDLASDPTAYQSSPIGQWRVAGAGLWYVQVKDIRQALTNGPGCVFNVFLYNLTSKTWSRENAGGFGGGDATAGAGSTAQGSIGASTQTNNPDLYRYRSYTTAAAAGLDGDSVNNTGQLLYANSGPQMVSDKGYVPYSAKELLLPTCIPIEESLHVYLNGVEQYRPEDWLLKPPDATHAKWWVEAQTPMDARSGDLLEVRYACAANYA